MPGNPITKAITPLHAEKRTVKENSKKQLERFQQKRTEIPAGMSSLPSEAVAASYAKAFAVREKSIRSRATFIAQYDDCRGELITWVNRLEVLLEKILRGAYLSRGN